MNSHWAGDTHSGIAPDKQESIMNNHSVLDVVAMEESQTYKIISMEYLI